MNIEQTIREYIQQIVHMSLATSKDNAPWVCEVHFAVDDDLNIYFRSLPSRRHSQEIAANPKVAGNIVTQHFRNQAVRGVYFEGLARRLEQGEEQAKAFDCLKARLNMSDVALQEANSQPDAGQFYKISVTTFYLFDSYTAKPGQKYELLWNGGKK